MKRLTRRDITGVPFCQNAGYLDMLNKLASYEDTGLEPEEVRRKIESLEMTLNVAIAKNEALNTAELEGRLVVLPCKVGSAVFAIKDRRIYDVFVIGFAAHEWKEGFNARLLFDSRKTNGTYEYELSEFGRTVFLSRKEAEAALRGDK